MPTNRKRAKRTPKKRGTLTEPLVDFFLKGKLPAFQDPDPEDIFAFYFFDIKRAKELWNTHREKILKMAKGKGIAEADIFAIQQYEGVENV